MWKLAKSFRFEAARAQCRSILGEASEEIHGHSFRTEVTVRGTLDPKTGIVLDLGLLERRMAEVQNGNLRSSSQGTPATKQSTLQHNGLVRFARNEVGDFGIAHGHFRH